MKRYRQTTYTIYHSRITSRRPTMAMTMTSTLNTNTATTLALSYSTSKAQHWQKLTTAAASILPIQIRTNSIPPRLPQTHRLPYPHYCRLPLMWIENGPLLQLVFIMQPHIPPFYCTHCFNVITSHVSLSCTFNQRRPFTSQDSPHPHLKRHIMNKMLYWYSKNDYALCWSRGRVPKWLGLI